MSNTGTTNRTAYRACWRRTAGTVHGGLAGIEQVVGVVVGDGVYALGVVAVLHEVPEYEVDGRDYLGRVPPAVPVEDVVQPFSTQHVAGPDAEHVAGGPLL